MDPDNYDNYGGVEHAEYCFQVNFNNLINDYRSVVIEWVILKAISFIKIRIKVFDRPTVNLLSIENSISRWEGATVIDWLKGAKYIRIWVGFNSTLSTACVATPALPLLTSFFKYCFVVAFGRCCLHSTDSCFRWTSSSSRVLVLVLHICLLHIFWALFQFYFNSIS
jgi:hypothetical protein